MVQSGRGQRARRWRCSCCCRLQGRPSADRTRLLSVAVSSGHRVLACWANAHVSRLKASCYPPSSALAASSVCTPARSPALTSPWWRRLYRSAPQRDGVVGCRRATCFSGCRRPSVSTLCLDEAARRVLRRRHMPTHSRTAAQAQYAMRSALAGRALIRRRLLNGLAVMSARRVALLSWRRRAGGARR